MALSKDELRNRFGTKVPQSNQAAYNHARLRDEYHAFASLLNDVLPEGRAKSIALTELETAAMWSHKAMAEKVDSDSDG